MSNSHHHNSSSQDLTNLKCDENIEPVSSPTNITKITVITSLVLNGRSTLRRVIEDLKPTGSKGFEGLVTLVAEAWIGSPLTLARSGDQKGRDASSSLPDGPIFGVEAKHYKSSKISTREILAELAEIADDRPDLDVYIVATLASVSDQTRRELQKEGRRRGIDVVFIGSEGPGVSDLEVFLAEKPGWADEFVPSAQKLSVILELDNIRTSTNYNIKKDAIFAQLNTYGYDAAAESSHRYLRSHVEADAEARAAFGQSLNVLDPQIRFVDRPSIRARLDDWWSSSTRSHNFQILAGAEGTGKTWLAFRWVAQQVNRSGKFPLIIPFTSKTVTTHGAPLDFLAHQLSNILEDPKRDMEYWRNKILRWEMRPREMPFSIMLIFDGINERTDVDWKSHFRWTQTERWRRVISLVVTCRPQYLREHLSEVHSVQGAIHTVSDYTDAELREAFIGTTETGELPLVTEEVGGLIRRPRYCDRVRKMPPPTWAQLTTAQLIFDDWQDRRSRKDQTTLTTDEFNDLLVESARTLVTRKNLRKQDIANSIATRHLEASVLQDLVDGGIFERRTGLLPQFRLSENHMTMALAIALIEDIALSPVAETPRAIDRFLASVEGASVEGNILFFAHYIGEATDMDPEIRQGLFCALVTARNLSDDILNSLIASAPAHVETLTKSVLYCWSDHNSNLLAQSRIAKCLMHVCSAAPKALCQPVLEWCGLVCATESLSDLEADAYQKRLKSAGFTGGDGSTVVICGKRHRLTSDPGHIRLHRLSLLLVSTINDPFLFLPALASLQTSRVIMGMFTLDRDLSWVFAFHESRLSKPALACASQMAERRSDILESSAFLLLSAVGTREAIELRKSFASPWTEMPVEDDPCLGPYAWQRDNVEKCAARPELDGKDLSWNLHSFVSDAQLNFSESCGVRIENLLDGLSPEFMWQDAEFPHVLHRYVEIVSARLSPARYANWVRSCVRCLPNLSGAWSRNHDNFVWHLSKYWMLLDEENLDTLRARWKESLAICPEDTSMKGQVFLSTVVRREMDLFYAALIGTDIAAQLSAFISRRKSCFDALNFVYFLGELDKPTLDQIVEIIKTGDVRAVSRALMFFYSHETLPDELVEVLSKLYRDRDIDRGIASQILRLALTADNEALAAACLASDATFLTREGYSVLGAQVLAKAPGVNYSLVRHRLSAAGRTVFLARSTNSIDMSSILECARDLENEWLAISGAPKHELESGLPDVFVVDDPSIDDVAQPQLEQPPLETRFYNSYSCWGGEQLKGRRGPTHPETEENLARTLASSLKSIQLAGKSVPTSWWATPFSPDFFCTLAQKYPPIARQWAAQALCSGGSVWSRGYTFYVAICRGMLMAGDDIGEEMWRRARAESTSVRLVSKKANLSWYACAAFESDSRPARNVRRQLVDESLSDAGLMEIVLATMEYSRLEWLSEYCKDTRDCGLIPKMKVIVLSAMAGLDAVGLEDTPEFGEFGHLTALYARKLRQDDYSMRHWYTIFLTNEDPDIAWAASRLFVDVVDPRFWGWREQIERDANVAPGNRRAYLVLMNDEILNAVNKKWEKWRNSFLGKDIGNVQVAPFINEL
jgi:hypothetical protein